MPRRFLKYKDKIPRPLPLITGASQKTRLRYVEITNMTLGGASPVSQALYYMNGLYDASAGSATTTIPGFTEWGALYNRYRVTDASIKFELVNLSNAPVYMGIAFDPAGTAFGSWSSYMESRANKHAEQLLLQAYPADGNKGTIYMKRNMGEVFGNKKEYMASDFFAGTPASNPTYYIIGEVYVLGYTPTTNTGVCPIKVEIDFWVDWYDPKLVFN